MYFLSVKALIPAITLISEALALSARSAKYNDTLPAYHTGGHKHAPHANTTVPWTGSKTNGADKVNIVTVVIKKPVTTICVTETSGSLSGSVYTYSTYTGHGSLSSKSSSPTKAGYTTSTILSTVTYTITSCAPTVTKCPVGLVTETVYTYTTVCPISESSSSSYSSAPYKNSSTATSSSSASVTSTASGTITLSSSSGSVVISTSSSASSTSTASGTSTLSSSSGSVTSSASVSVSSETSSLSSSESVSIPTSSSVSSGSVSVSSFTSASSSLISSSTSSDVISSSSSTSALSSSSSASVSSSTTESSSVIISTSSLSSSSSSASVTPSTTSSSSVSLSSSSSSSSSSVEVTPTPSTSSTSSSLSSTSSSTSSSVLSSSSTSKTSSSSLTSSTPSSSSISSSAVITSSSATTSSSSSTSSSLSSSSKTSSSTLSSSSSSSSSIVSSTSSTSSSSSSSSIATSSSSSSKTSSSSVISSSSSSSSLSSSTSSSSSSSLSSSASKTSSSSITSSSSSSSSSSLSSSASKTSSSSATSSSSSSSSSSLTSSKTSSSSSITSSSSSSKTSSTSSSTSSSATPTQTACYYWMENVKKQGIAPFNAAPGTYQVFRNVKDFGAKGDGVTDDTAAINLAISSGSRCVQGGQCGSTTTSPAIVYFPSGTYMVSAPIIDFYYTQMIGNPNCMPVIKATSSFRARWVVEGDAYIGDKVLSYGPTNVFWRQMRNFVMDLTSVPAGVEVAAIHWPTSQATSLQNIVFQMSSVSGTKHEGIFCESGSGGFMTDLVFYGGLHGALFANQQFTMRNMTFYNAVTAISQAFDWGWTYKGLSINNCSVGIDMSSVGDDLISLSVGSVTLIDSVFTNTPIGISTGKSSTSTPATANSLIIENVQFKNVPVIVSGAGSTVLLAGSAGSVTVAGWGQGHYYAPGTTGPFALPGTITPNARTGLTAGADFYERSKPQYEKLSVSSFVSVRSAGAKGDGVTDDSDILISVIASAAASGKIVYFDAGDYLVTKTIYIPAGSKITGETYPVILSSGTFFADMSNPKPVVQVGLPGETGNVEWSEMIVSTKGAQAGAILIEWNLATTGTPSGMWDVHTRIGGFAGSNLQVANCPKTPATVITSANVPAQCIAAFMSMHITASATGLYMENVWLWVADHDVEDAALTQITVYAGRGLLIESTLGLIWLYGTAVEHHTLYQYQLVSTGNIFMGQIQTETAYYQPNPSAVIPFPAVAKYSDPTIATGASGWGVRVLKSGPVLIYGAGLYSFFSNYDVHCSDQGNGETCQSNIFSIEQSTVMLYNLNTVGTGSMITKDGVNFAAYSDNLNGFVDTVALYRS